MQGSLESPPIIIHASRGGVVVRVFIIIPVALLCALPAVLFDLSFAGHALALYARVALLCLCNGVALAVGVIAYLIWRAWRWPSQLVVSPAGLVLDHMGGKRAWPWDQVDRAHLVPQYRAPSAVVFSEPRARVMLPAIWEASPAYVLGTIQSAKAAWQSDVSSARDTPRPKPSIAGMLFVGGAVLMLVGLVMILAGSANHRAKSDSSAPGRQVAPQTPAVSR